VDDRESALKAATEAAGIEYTLKPGRGRLLRPEARVRAERRHRAGLQCGTLQVDLNMPGRLGGHYIDEHSQKRTPVMLHRAIFGSLERFFAIL